MLSSDTPDRGALIYPTSFVFLPILFAPLLFWLLALRSRGVVPNVFARVSPSGTPSDATRALLRSASRMTARGLLDTPLNPRAPLLDTAPKPCPQ
jgi:hypothetical protein